MAGNGDRSDDDRGDKSVPNTMSATFHLDHVGEVAVLMDSDSLSWKSVRAGESKDCLGFASFVMTEVSFSNIYAADFINWGIIHEPIIPNSRAHFLSRGSKVTMYRFAVHGFQKSKAQNSPWVPVVHIFGNSDAETCLLWTERINASLSLQPGRPKNLLVFVHPLSGKGKGLRTWEGVAPIFCSAKVRTKVVVTERAGHAFDMMSSITFSELKSYDGVIAVGGDGFFSEILNGFLLSRHNAPYPPAPVEFKNSYGNTNNCPGEGVCNSSSSSFGPSLDQGQDQEPLLHIPEAMDSVHKDFRAKDGSCNLDRDATFSIPHEWFRFGIIPAGSTDAIVICTTGTRDAATSALQIVLGPLRVKKLPYDGSLPSLTLNPHSWSKVVNIIFLDQPVGTGFSYASIANYSMTDTKAAKLVHQFIRKWLNDHPLFLSSPMYVAGDSYSGHVVPVVVQEVSDGIEAGQEPRLNLKGYILGNPSTDSKYDSGSQVPFVHGVGLISDELYEAAQRSCGGDYTNTENPKCAEAVLAVDKTLTGLDPFHILEPICVLASRKPGQMLQNRRVLNENLKEQPIPDFICRTYDYMLAYHWANNDTVQQALAIHEGTIKEWQRCNDFITYEKDVRSALDYHRNLSTKGYRVLVYSGDHDLTFTHLGTQAWIRSLNFSIVSDWRSWWVGGQVAGYTRTYANNMTFATVKGGGHTAPEYRPKECFGMIQRWAFGLPL